jgi:hypothetical protein
MTLSDNLAREAEQASNAQVIPFPGVNAQGRAPARDPTPGHTSIAFDALTQSVHGVLALRAPVLAAVRRLDHPGGLLDAQPATIRGAWGQQQAAVRYFDAALLRWPRRAWAFGYLGAVKPALNGTEALALIPVWFAAGVGTPPSLVDCQIPTGRQTIHRVRASAPKLGPASVLLYAYTAFYLAVLKPILNGAEWVAASPARFAVAVAVAACIWIWG